MRVLVAIDGTALSKSTVAAAVKRDWNSGTMFKILAVVPNQIIVSNEGEENDIQLEKEREILAAQKFEKRKEIVVARCRKYQLILEQAHPSCSVEIEIKVGNPAPEIIKAATEWTADQVVIGKFKIDTCDHCVWGSVSNAVLKRVRCPVKVVRNAEVFTDSLAAC